MRPSSTRHFIGISQRFDRFLGPPRGRSSRLLPSRLLWASAKKDDLTQALSEAEKLVGYPTSFLSLRCLLSDELSNVAMYKKRLVGSKHPLLKTARGFVYDGQYGMQTRGLLVLLVAKAAAPYLSSDDVSIEQEAVSGIYPGQRQLAEITEMINTAYLIHCGVVNLELLSPLEKFKDMEFGNKMSVLTGDFLLANACTGLAQLNNTHVVDMISKVIGDLMEGQAMQNHCTVNDLSLEFWRQVVFRCKASLLASSCQAVLKLMDHSSQLQEKAFEFGNNIAFAHQLKEESQSLQDPQASISINNVSVILSLHKREVKELVETLIRVKSEGDIDAYEEQSKKLHHYIDEDSITRVQEMMVDYSEKAFRALKGFPPSETRQALENIVHTVSHSHDT